MGAGPGEGGAVGLAGATDVDTVARVVLEDLLTLPDVTRVGLALVEGGGRRLRFLPLVATDEPSAAVWCHIDAYDDVPLTSVLRTGRPVLGGLDDFGDRYAGLVAAQREAGTRALAAVPLPGASAPLGGLLLYFGRVPDFAGPLRHRLDDLARRTADAMRRVRLRSAGAVSAAVVESDVDARRASVLLDDDLRAPRAARRFLRETLGAWEVADDVVETAELCLSELVTNAVIHAGASSRLTLALADGRLTVSVQDHAGPAAEEVARVVEDDDPLRVFGRGLVLVDTLADRWGSERNDLGTSSWFLLEVDSDERTAC